MSYFGRALCHRQATSTITISAATDSAYTSKNHWTTTHPSLHPLHPGNHHTSHTPGALDSLHVCMDRKKLELWPVEVLQYYEICIAEAHGRSCGYNNMHRRQRHARRCPASNKHRSVLLRPCDSSTSRFRVTQTPCAKRRQGQTKPMHTHSAKTTRYHPLTIRPMSKSCTMFVSLGYMTYSCCRSTMSCFQPIDMSELLRMRSV